MAVIKTRIVTNADWDVEELEPLPVSGGAEKAPSKLGVPKILSLDLS